MRTRRHDDGFTLIELLIVVAIIGIIAAIAVPGLLRARMSGNEASAIGSLRAINTAQQNFSQFCNGYADALTDLAMRPGGQQPYLSPDMTAGATVDKSGYRTTMAAGARGVPVLAANTNAMCAAVGVTNGYYATAVAINWGLTGARAFATDELGTIFQDASQNVPPPQPLTPGGNVQPIQ
ncbi:MAG TPA: prepilin-type N-terminal cleavage/methylation domain-containing protein [Vicinamibacterales bacterium]|nr:prepilin-type N-terminal cleavage/methylation domain-containing protein [Vicinamibacterales bacterium]